MLPKYLASFILVLTLFISFTTSATVDNNLVPSNNKSHFEEAFMKKLNSKCLQRDTGSCLMVKFVGYMNRMLKKSSIEINDSVELTQTRDVADKYEEEEEEIIARSTGSDEETLSVLAANKIWRFISSRTLRWKMLDDADFLVSSTDNDLNVGLTIHAKDELENGRGKKNNGIGPAIIGAIVAKVLLLKALAFKGLLLLVGKAFLISKIALVLALVTALKKLFAKKHVTYEVVAHPTSSHEHHHHDSYSGGAVGGGWGRALDGFVESFVQATGDAIDAHNVAYKAQKP